MEFASANGITLRRAGVRKPQEKISVVCKPKRRSRKPSPDVAQAGLHPRGVYDLRNTVFYPSIIQSATDEVGS